MPDGKTRWDGSALEAMRKRRIVHEASLTDVLIFCKKLPSEPLPRRLNPKVALFQGQNPLGYSEWSCAVK
jgi:hypothetical protein